MPEAMLARTVRLLALAALALLALPSAGQAYVLEGQAWPGGVIRYYNAAPDQQWALTQAVNAWNRSGAQVRFVPAPASEAQVVVRHPGSACTSKAWASVGYAPSAYVDVSRLDDRSPFCNRYAAAELLVHELGHVLGLGHETRGCAAMNPDGYLQGPSLCPQAPSWQWHCRLLEPDDVAGAIAIYGGAAAQLPAQPDCDLYAPIRAPGKLAVAWSGVEGQLRVSFRRPASIRVPDFLRGRGPEAYAVSLTPGTTCPTDPGSLPHYRWRVPPGAMQAEYETPTSGPSCLAVWAFDSFGRPSRAATLVVTA